MASHRSQGGPFHFIQPVKHKSNINCKHYLDGKCKKDNRVCEINDVCFGFEPRYARSKYRGDNYSGADNIESNPRKKEKCKYFDGFGFCTYLEKKCTAADNCISFRCKEGNSKVENHKKSYIALELWIYTYRSNNKFKDFCVLDNMFNNYIIDGVECVKSFEHSKVNRIKNHRELVFKNESYQFVSKQLKKVTLILKHVAKSSFRIQQETELGYASQGSSRYTQGRVKEKKMCKYNKNNYCIYLEKKCHGTVHCISYREM